MIEELRSFLDVGGISLDVASEEKMAAYHAMLLEWNRHIDLTNVPEEEMALRHYADSVLPLMQKTWFPQGARLIDVGSGAGFPGMPLAIARSDMDVTLLDAQRKRCDFLQAVADKLELKNVTVMHGRAEEAAHSQLRESMDIAVARAVAPMNVLCEYLLPFVRVGGYALCWKGPGLFDEKKAGSTAAAILGSVEDVLLRLPIENREHYVQAYLKQATTDVRYPRRAGKPLKAPLGE